MRLSIVIPTYQRPATLQRCLEYIAVQTVPHNALEVIVVNDGEDRQAERIVTARVWPFRILYSSIPKSQQGAARNRGVEMATGDIILFIGDDIFLAPNACEIHLALHQKGVPLAVLGFTTWDPSLEITPIMRWLESSGWQFDYGRLARYGGQKVPVPLQHFVTYTSHISVPRSLAQHYPFTATKRYGWEDVEWGLRLSKAGIPLYYEPQATAVHHHLITLKDSLNRAEILGETAVEFTRLVPELALCPRGMKRFLQMLQSLLPGYAGQHRRAFLRGVRRAEKHLHGK